MDFFKFTESNLGPTYLERGELIQGLKSSSWIERYRDPGEFTFEAPVKSDILNFLPLGSYVSHIDTLEVMVVENHEVNETNNALVKVSGRSLETILEQRIVGAELDRTWPPVAPLADYALTSTHTYVQATMLIDHHIGDSFYDGVSVDNGMPGFKSSYTFSDLSVLHEDPTYAGGWAASLPPGFVFESSEDPRTIKRTNVHAALMEILNIEDRGIKIVRSGPWGRGGAYSEPLVGEYPGPWTEDYYGPPTIFFIHNGRNRSHKVVFSHSAGDIKNADYLWSIKTKKNHAIVSGKWVEVVVTNDELATKDSRRTMWVDGSFLDNNFDVAPTGTNLTNIQVQMELLGLMKLSEQKDVSLMSVEVGTGSNYLYRKDYDIGDIVRVDGNYGTNRFARVIEHVEIEDETGETNYPTLLLI